MPGPEITPTAAFGAAFFVVIALAIYAGQLRRILSEGGKVEVGQLDLPELLMSIVFAGFFGMIVVSAVHRHKGDTEVNIDSVLPNSLLFVIFTVGIAGFMRFRGLRLRKVFGLDRMPLWKALAWAVGLILAALPIAAGANALTLLASHEKLEPQPLVNLFSDVASHHKVSAMAIILTSAVFIQPACEEFLFRGFFYGTWKRYLGPFGAGFLASLLFAAFHTSITAFAGLFVLAVCLNIAYERTGSLLVPIGMHALFNLTSLLVIYAQTQLAAKP